MELAKWDVDVLAPMASGSINFSNYLPEENFSSGSGSLIHLIAEDTVINLGLDTILGIPDYSIDTGFFFPVPAEFLPGQPIFNDLDEITFNLKDVKLTSAIIRESKIVVEAKNTLDQPLLFQYEIQSATLDGDTFRVEQRIEGDGVFSDTFDLNGYTLDLRGTNGNKVNTIVSKIVAMLHPDLEGPQQIKGGDRFEIVNTVTNVVPEYVTGYFGSQAVQFDEEESLDAFAKIPFESVNITDFSIDLIIDNGIGADLELRINEIKTRNTDLDEEASLNHEIVGSTQQFTRAINFYDPSNPVKHIQKTYQFTDENSNLDKLLELKPNQIFADMSVQVNPLGNISLGNDFAYYDHNLTAFMRLDVPLVISVKGAQLKDTINFSYDGASDGDISKQLNNGNIKAYITNGFPVDATMQFTFLDTAYQPVFSLLSEPALVSGAIEFKGRVGAVGESLITIPISQETFEQLQQSTFVEVDAMLSTVGTDSIHIRSNQNLVYKLIADFNLSSAP